MANIRVDLDYMLQDGAEIKFRSPVDCSQITGLIVYYPGENGNITSKVFTLADAHGNNVGDIDHLFAEDVVVKVILDVTKGMAFVQNADTNAYLEEQLASKATTPKTVRGSSVAMNDSGYAQLQGLKLYGKTTQFTTTGKNLFDGKLPYNYSFSGSGQNRTVITASYSHSAAVIPVTPGATYAFSGDFTNATDDVLRWATFENMPEVGSVSVSYGNAATTTIPENCHYLLLWLMGSNNEEAAIQVELGSTATAYEPYTGGKPAPNPDYPQELESVGESGNIGVTVLGKNLAPGGTYNFTKNTSINFEKPLTPGIYTVSAEITSSGTNTTYSRIYFYDENNQTFADVNIGRNGRNSATVELTAPAAWARIFAETTASNSDGDTATWANVQIEYGDTATAYEPFKSVQTITASTPNGLPGIPVASGGNYTDESGQQWICDEVDFAKGVYVQRVYEQTLDNASKFNYGTSSSGIPYLDIFSKVGFKIGAKCLCNGYVWASSVKEGAIRVFGNAVSVYNTKFTDLETAKALLAEMDFKALCQLAEEKTIALSAEELAQYAALHTNKPNTTVFNDAGADMEITYCTPNTAVPMNMGSGNAGKVLSVDKHGCVTTAPDVVITSLAELDTKVHSGWYGFYYGGDESCNIGGYLSGGIRVDKTREGAYQTFYPDDAVGTVLKRHLNGTVWDEWEWENPPMFVDVEYRTTERWQGKPKYRKLFHIGGFTGAKNTDLPNGNLLVKAECLYFKDGKYCIAIPYVYEYSGSTMIEISLGSENACDDAWIEAWYIKE